MKAALDDWLQRMQRAAEGDLALSAWSIYATESRRLSLGIKDRQTGNAHAPLSIAEGTSARYLFVWHDGSVSRGVLQSAQLAPEAPLDSLLSEARRASYSDPDAARVGAPADFPEVAIHDGTTSAIAAGATDDVASRLGWLRDRIDGSSIKTWSGSFSAGEGRSRVVTSRGLDVAGQGTSWGWFASADGLVGDGFAGRRVDPLEAFERRVTAVVDKADRLRGVTADVPNGPSKILLHPDVVDRYALSTLLVHLDGSTVANEEGRFSREQFGDGSAHLPERMSLRLDPFRPFGGGSYAFTAEGVPAARCDYVDRGRLVQPFCTLKYAHRLDRDPTPIPYDSESLEFELGERLSEMDALADGRTLLVLSVLGIHTQDSTSGDFSLAAPQILVFEDGRCIGRQKGTISGNLFEAIAAPETRLVDLVDEPVPGMLLGCHFEAS